MAISQVEVEPEDVFEKVRGKAMTKVKQLLSETYARDKEDFRNDLAEVLDVEEENELPRFEVEVRLTLGKQVVSVSGFEVEEKDEDEDMRTSNPLRNRQPVFFEGSRRNVAPI